MAEPALARLLLGPELERAVSRTFPATALAPVLALSGLASLMLCDERRRDRRRRAARWQGGNDHTYDGCFDPCCDPCGCCNLCECGRLLRRAATCGDCCGACDCSC